MNDQPSNPRRDRGPETLIWHALTVLGVCLLLGLVAGGGEVVAVTVGRTLWGDPPAQPGVGAWLGWGASFVVTLVVCCLVVRLVANPVIPVLCGASFGYALSTLAVATRPHIGERWARATFVLLFLAGGAVGMWLFKLIARRREAGGTVGGGGAA